MYKRTLDVIVVTINCITKHTNNRKNTHTYVYTQSREEKIIENIIRRITYLFIITTTENELTNNDGDKYDNDGPGERTDTSRSININSFFVVNHWHIQLSRTIIV